MQWWRGLGEEPQSNVRSAFPLGKGSKIVIDGCKRLLWLWNCKLPLVAESSTVSQNGGVRVASPS